MQPEFQLAACKERMIEDDTAVPFLCNKRGIMHTGQWFLLNVICFWFPFLFGFSRL